MSPTVPLLGITSAVPPNGSVYGHRGSRLLAPGPDSNRYPVTSEEPSARKTPPPHTRDPMPVSFHARLRMRPWPVGLPPLLAQNRDPKNKAGGGVFWEVGTSAVAHPVCSGEEETVLAQPHGESKTAPARQAQTGGSFQRLVKEATPNSRDFGGWTVRSCGWLGRRGLRSH